MEIKNIQEKICSTTGCCTSGYSKMTIVLVVLGAVWLAVSSVNMLVDIKSRPWKSYPTNTLPITSEGRVPSVPDMATVQLGVQTDKPTAEEAKNELTTNINKLMEFVKKEGVDEKDVKSDNFNIYPNPTYNPDGTIGKTRFVGNTNITVKVKGLDKKKDLLSSIVGGSVSNGANQVYGVNYGFEDSEKNKQEARKMAIQKAKERASELAELSGFKIGRIVSITDNNNSSGPYYAETSMGIGGGGMEKAASPDLAPGQQDIVVNMTVIFELK